MFRFVFGILTFLAFVTVLDGCTPEGTKPSESDSVRTTRWKREGDTSIISTGGDLGLILRPSNMLARVSSNFRDPQAEKIFGRIDKNSNGMIDAAEWVNFSKETSIWDFVKLLDYADVNDDELVSLEEFLSVKIVKINPSEDGRNAGGVTS